MPLTLYNTLTRRKEPFEPIEPGKVRMYVCGITAYNYFHVGNARVFVVFDVVRRYLKWRGYDVRYVQNFTDIDDKILKRALAENSTMEQIAEKYIAAYFEDADRLNILRADAYPRATHAIDGIQRLIHELEQQQYAYAADGDVYYVVRQFADYGKLSGRKLEEMQAGASGRVDEEADKKKDPADFALWKAAKPGEPFWESRWGKGRPGWHIECSAMVRDELGESIDIHGGGIDLTFPHHENEIAQSEAVTGKPLAKYWLHNGFINMDGEKMSKSLGNFRLTRDLFANYDPMAFRLFVLQAQYRKPIDFTADALDAAVSSWKTLKEALQFGTQFAALPGWQSAATDNLDQAVVDRFNEAMDDDINTPIALSVVFELAKALSREGNQLVHQGNPDLPVEQLQRQWQTFISLLEVLGLDAKPGMLAGEIVSSSSLTGDLTVGLSDAAIEALIQQRQEARQSKNWAESDRIRNELQSQGITLIDQKDGVTRWHRN
ncbi:cysteine--tRNA ligase [Leptolyngbya sp. FACHB-321]|uniref:cysteine--tRNA ligase n=1 Tax=Leptolyngbya sp. FACHB-321 TaxID=2692807 RepID=UPI0016883C41|nr:cysteine--tRNA ligase [Leptolyngbya sp. FACHB-321]MBD2037336.1 cysteine--tRNA ligase [Leptolyngbya sp. FACHB-321]